jgi:uncharacterized membrane protein YjfL (UPF0719 family)
VPIQFVRVFPADAAHVLEFRKNAAAALVILGLLIGINLVGASKIIHTSHKEAMTTPSPVSKASRFMDMVFLLGINAAGYCFFTGANGPAACVQVLKQDFDHILEWHPDLLLGLPIAGFVLSVAVQCWLFQAVTMGSLKSRAMYLAVSVLVAGLFAYSLMSGHITSYQTNRWRHVWSFRKNIAFALLAAGTLLPSFLGSSKRLVQKMLPLGPVLWTSVSVAVPAVYVLSENYVFMQDVGHVIDLRKNVAAVFCFVGTLLGVIIARTLSRAFIKVLILQDSKFQKLKFD